MSHEYKKVPWLFIIILIIILIIFLITLIKQALNFHESNQLRDFFSNLNEQTPVMTSHNPRKGNEKAKVIIYEFSDFKCTYCAEMNSVVNKIINDYQDQVLFVWKQYPLAANSTASAIAAQCANEQNKFWEYKDILFQNQNSQAEIFFQQTATGLGLDINKFQACQQSDDTADDIDDDINEGFLLQVDATPYFFINDVRVSGYINYQDFKNIIEQELVVNS